MFSVFSALGLNVGIHPIIQNRSENMGGLSAKELLHGPTVPREGDFVENFLDDSNDSDNDSKRYEEEGMNHRAKIPEIR